MLLLRSCNEFEKISLPAPPSVRVNDPVIRAVRRFLPLFCVFQFGLIGGTQEGPSATDSATIEHLLKRGQELEKAAQYESALAVLDQITRRETSDANQLSKAKALVLRGICEIHLFHYRAALTSLQSARDLSIRLHDETVAGAAAANVSVVFAQLGDFALAEKHARQSVDLLARSTRRDSLALAFLNCANIEWDNGAREDGEKSYRKGIAVAQNAGLRDTEAKLWDNFGTSLLLTGETSKAKEALDNAQRLELETNDWAVLAVTEEHQAELELKMGHYESALRRIDRAFSLPSAYFKTSPQYYPLHIRGLILRKLGRSSEALVQLRRAVDSAGQWRKFALPGDGTSTRTVAYLHDVYHDYSELAAEIAIQRHDNHLAREALGVLAENRAASLREQIAASLGREFRLPPDYYQLISEIQKLQSTVTLSESTSTEESKLRSLRLDLRILDNSMGLERASLSQGLQKISRSASISAIQQKLGSTEALLAFGLGNNESFLWALTRDHIELCKLPAEEVLGRQASAFSDAVRTGRNTSAPGKSLSKELFSKLDSDVVQKPNWLIVADGVLLEGIPWAALPENLPAPQTSPLIARHTLRLLPSELLLLRTETNPASSRFIGVADPIYSIADRRSMQRGEPHFSAGQLGEGLFSLSQLPGSHKEVRRAAMLSGMSDSELLIGTRASGVTLLAALRKKPQILHFAVHVVSPQGHPEQAALALSLTKDNIPELLTPEAVPEYHVPGALVVLDGCTSDAGERIPSAGLIGLSRAWLVAGASAVIVSTWPMPESSGRLFDSFYTHFSSLGTIKSLSQRTASALQAAQRDLDHDTGHPANSAAVWAGYSIISIQ